MMPACLGRDVPSNRSALQPWEHRFRPETGRQRPRTPGPSTPTENSDGRTATAIPFFSRARLSRLGVTASSDPRNQCRQIQIPACTGAACLSWFLASLANVGSRVGGVERASSRIGRCEIGICLARTATLNWAFCFRRRNRCGHSGSAATTKTQSGTGHRWCLWRVTIDSIEISMTDSGAGAVAPTQVAV